MFAAYYDRLNDGQSIYAVNPQGTTITIGKKNDEGDVFFERIVAEEEEHLEDEQELEELHDLENQESEEDNVEEGEIGDPDDWWADEETPEE
jgi:hypothetical protein